MSKILSVTTQAPDHKYHIDQIVEAADQLWLSQIDPSIRNAALKIFRGAEITTRHSVVPIEIVFSDMSFKEKNDLYMKHSILLAEKTVRKALAEANVQAQEIDFIISTSCTGFMIPSVDAYLVNSLGFRDDVVRLPVTEMGCAGGTSALIYAKNFTKANPGKKILVISVEIPSITFQKNDLSMENLVSTAIFADGAAAVILGDPKPGDPRSYPEIIETDMYHFRDGTHLMGYQLTNSGLKIVLDRDVPDTIQEHFPRFFYNVLKRQNLNVEDVHHYMFHPGGKKIINRVEDFIGRFGKSVATSKAVLKEHGNLSSATILHILEREMKLPNKNRGDYGYMLAFGPGFSAQSLLLKWT